MNIILDYGHGGILNGQYQTKGKRSPKWDDGTQLFEGVFNRSVGSKLTRLLEWDEIDFDILVTEQSDVSLSERVRRANNIYNKRKDSILISVHANGFSNESANGFEVFTSNGSTKSDEYAKIIHSTYIEKITEIKDRGIKEAGFAMVKRTNCPAVLIECGFMTNHKECQFLLNNEYRIARAIFEGIRKLK
tara:strand:- start:2456 stop:3025 length:570 start_codon:yes stop_codon:yes gene_type:complete